MLTFLSFVYKPCQCLNYLLSCGIFKRSTYMFYTFSDSGIGKFDPKVLRIAKAVRLLRILRSLRLVKVCLGIFAKHLSIY